MTPKLVLGLETSTHSGGVALLNPGAEALTSFSAGEENSVESACLVGSVCFTTKQLYSQRLLPGIQWLLERTEVEVEDIALIGISVGPGSFTGLRIGLSVAKALAYASGAKLVGVGTLEALAVRASGGSDALVCPLLDARHGQVYAALYRVSWSNGIPRVETAREEWAGPVEEVAQWITEPTIFAGDALSVAKDRLAPTLGSNLLLPPAHHRLPNPEEVAVLAMARAMEQKFDDAVTLEPRYVRQSYIR